MFDKFENNPFLSETDVQSISALFDNGMKFCINNVLNKIEKDEEWRTDEPYYYQKNCNGGVVEFDFKGFAVLCKKDDRKYSPDPIMYLSYSLTFDFHKDHAWINFEGRLNDYRWNRKIYGGALFRKNDNDYCSFEDFNRILNVYRSRTIEKARILPIDADFHEKITKTIYDGAIQFFIDLANGLVKAYKTK